MTYFDVLQKSFRCWLRRTARHSNPDCGVLHSQLLTTELKAGRAERQGAVVDGKNVGTVRILSPWLQKQAGFPGDGVACVVGRLCHSQQTGGTRLNFSLFS